MGAVSHGQPAEVESVWESGTNGSFGISHKSVGEGLFFGDDIQPGHVHAHHFHAAVVDGPVVVIGGEDIEVVEFLGFGHGNLAGSTRLESLIAFVHFTLDTLVGEGHHWEHGSEFEIEVTGGVEFVLLGLALLTHFPGERGVSLDLIPLSGESSLVEVLDDVSCWAGSETHSGFSSHNGRGGEGNNCFGVHCFCKSLSKEL